MTVGLHATAACIACADETERPVHARVDRARAISIGRGVSCMQVVDRIRSRGGHRGRRVMDDRA